MRVKYVCPFTDFGFHRLFGEEAGTPLLLDFLNALLPEQNKIIEVSFKNPEQPCQTETKRKALFDVFCENENGERFIVELQKAEQNYFKDRLNYYDSFPIKGRVEKGGCYDNFTSVYCVGVLNFIFKDYENESEKNKVVNTITLKNENGKTFFNKLTYIYLELPNFKQTKDELKTRLDKWLYFLRHLEDFQTIPANFEDEVFTRAFDRAEIAKFDHVEMDSYEYSLKIYRDLKAVIDTAFMEGFKQGKREELLKLQ